MASGGEIGSAFVRIRPNTSGFKSEMQTGLKGAFSGLAGAAGATAGIVGIGLAFKSVVTQAANFQSQLNLLKVVSSASDAQMKQVSSTAKALGNDITIPGASAADAAQAMTELAKGGLSVDSAMKAAKGTLQLAAAAGIDNASAATIQANALNAFGLSGRNAREVADVLAASANASTGEITDMALALQQAGAQAHASGLTIEETSTAISLLANRGIQGSDAGTSLRVMLQRLVPQTTKAAQEMDKLGVTAFDSSGKMLPLRQIVEQYHDALVKLTPQQKAQALQTLFGADASRAANVIFGESVSAYDKMNAAVTKHGVAADVANARMKGFTGAMEQFKNAIQTVSITIGTLLLPILTPIVRELAAWVTALGNIGGTFASLRDHFSSLSEPAKIAAIAVGAITAGLVALKFAAATNPFIAFVTGALAIGAALRTAYQRSEEFRDIVQRVMRTVSAFWQEHSDQIRAATITAWNAVKTAITVTVNTIQTVITVSVAFVRRIWANHHDEIIKTAREAWTNVRELVVAVVGAISKIITTTVAVVQAVWGRYHTQITTVAQATWETISGIVRGALTVLRGIVNVFTGLLSGDWSKAWGGIRDIVSGAFGEIKAIVSGIGTGLLAVMQAAGDAAYRGMKAGFEPVVAFFEGIWKWLKITALEAALAVVEPFTHIPGWLPKAGKFGKWARDAKDSMTTELSKLKGEATGLGDAIGQNMADALNKSVVGGALSAALANLKTSLAAAATLPTIAPQIPTGLPPASAAGGSAGTESQAGVARQVFDMARQAGLTAQRAMEVVAAAYAESGLNPRNINKSSGAAGLFQLLSSGYRNRAAQLGGLFDVRANTQAILPDYVRYFAQHPSAQPGEAGRDVELSGEGSSFYSGPLGTVARLLGQKVVTAPPPPAPAPTSTDYRPTGVNLAPLSGRGAGSAAAEAKKAAAEAAKQLREEVLADVGKVRDKYMTALTEGTKKEIDAERTRYNNTVATISARTKLEKRAIDTTLSQEKTAISTGLRLRLNAIQTDLDRQRAKIDATRKSDIAAVNDKLQTELRAVTRVRDKQIEIIKEVHDRQLQAIQDLLDAQLLALDKQRDTFLAGVERTQRSEQDAFDNRKQDQLDAIQATHQAQLDAIDATHQAALDAIDAERAALTPAEQKIKDLQDAAEAAQRARDLADAQTQLTAAQSTGTPAEIAAAQQRVADAQQAITMAALQQQVTLERTAADKIAAQKKVDADAAAKQAQADADASAKQAQRDADERFKIEQQQMDDRYAAIKKDYDDRLAAQQAYLKKQAEADQKAVDDKAAKDKAKVEQDARDKAVADRKAAEAEKAAINAAAQKERRDALEVARKKKEKAREDALEAVADAKRLASNEKVRLDAVAAEQKKAAKAEETRKVTELEDIKRKESTNFNERLKALKTHLIDSKTAFEKSHTELMKLLSDQIGDWRESGAQVASSFADGIRSGTNEVAQAAAALAAVVRSHLKLSSPAETGPMSDLDTWWSKLGSTLMEGVDRGELGAALDRSIEQSVGGPRAVKIAGDGGSIADEVARLRQQNTDTAERDRLHQEALMAELRKQTSALHTRDPIVVHTGGRPGDVRR